MISLLSSLFPDCEFFIIFAGGVRGGEGLTFVERLPLFLIYEYTNK